MGPLTLVCAHLRTLFGGEWALFGGPQRAFHRHKIKTHRMFFYHKCSPLWDTEGQLRKLRAVYNTTTFINSPKHMEQCEWALNEELLKIIPVKVIKMAIDGVAEKKIA